MLQNLVRACTCVSGWVRKCTGSLLGDDKLARKAKELVAKLNK